MIRVWGFVLATVFALTAWGQTFGRVVALGGFTSDLALDEPRRSLYVANFTANRIDVVNLDTGQFQKSMNVASQPSSVALSPNGRWLVVTHYANFASPGTPKNAVTVIDMVNNTRQTLALSDPPYGVAFGSDNRALVVTSTTFFLLTPDSGLLQALSTISGVTAKSLPQPAGQAPTQIVGASMASTPDFSRVYGVTETFIFSYEVSNRNLAAFGYTAEPPLGPRAISIAKDGSYYLAGWGMWDASGLVLSQFPNPSGALNIGSHVIDSDRGLIYAQVPEGVQQTGSTGGTTTSTVPFLMVVDADNLAVREKLVLAENLSGKAVLTSDGSTMYALSDSGLMVLPVGQLNAQRRVRATVEDLVFRSNFCDRKVLTQNLTIVDDSGASTPFSLTTDLGGLVFSQSTGSTPATVKVSIDPAVYANLRGTISGTITIRSSRAANIIKQVRVLLTLQDPDQRGTAVNVPGKLVDLLADPSRNRFFLLRQDTNQVLVFDGQTYKQTATLRTGNTPTSLAVTYDQRYLLVGHDNSQYASVFDLETLEPQRPIRAPFGHYPRWLASSGRAMLAASRVAGPKHTVDLIDFYSRTSTPLPTLGVFENDIHINTALVATPNGRSIMGVGANGSMFMYDANVDTFTISRKDPLVPALSGAVAASDFGMFVIGNKLYNDSLVPQMDFDATVGTSSGFFFLDNEAFRTGATDSSSPGVIQRVDLASGSGLRTTRMVEAPVLGSTEAAFTRTVAVLPGRATIINLTKSGFTVLPYAYDAATAMPVISSVVNAADQLPALAPGSLIVIRGSNLSPVNIATQTMPYPTALGESCLTVNGVPVPMIFVSSSQINAQLPFQAVGNVSMILRTPGGVSDSYNLTILPAAPSIFRSADANAPLVVRAANNEVTTMSNPVRGGDTLVIYNTGMGRATVEVPAGQPAPADPLPTALVQPTVQLGDVELPVLYAGMTPGEVGVYQINVYVPTWVKKALTQTLRVTQGGYTTSVTVRVVE